MTNIRIGILQTTSSDDPADNIAMLDAMVHEAVFKGAEFILTPEVSNCVSTSRAWQQTVLRHQDEDPTLVAMRALAQRHRIWLLIGSLGIKTTDGDGRFANRSFLIDPDGAIAAQYDKIHMFDVNVSAEETYAESKGYRPGDKAVVAETPFAKIGLSVCYDVRFAHLYRKLAKAGAEILTVPAAFSHETGPAHWEPLLRARAIENTCFVLAPAQTGEHPAQEGKRRRTHGHSLVISPWGEVLLDAGTAPGVSIVDLDLQLVAQARQRINALNHDRPFGDP